MGLFSVKVYFNTGFNYTDIPASPSVVRTATTKSYSDTYYFREDVDKPFVDIKDTYDNLVDVDYVELINNNTGRSSFYFAVPSALSVGTTRLSLELDALTTMGGAPNLNYTSGIKVRGHILKSEDTLFSNVASEGFTPRQELVVSNIKELEPTGGVDDDLSIVYSNINLTVLGGDDADSDRVTVYTGYKDGEPETDVMYFPKVSSPNVRTTFSMYDFTSGTTVSYYVTGSAAYSLDSVVTQKALEKLFSMGITDISSSYFVPGKYCATEPIINDGSGGSLFAVYGSLEGIHSAVISSIPYVYSNVKNNKCYALYNNYTISNIASGDSVTRRASEIYTSGSTSPIIIIWSDVSPSGKPYARFKSINGNTLQYESPCQGSQWNNNQLCFNGASGSLWNTLNYSFSNATNDRNLLNLNNQYEYDSLINHPEIKGVRSIDGVTPTAALKGLSALSDGIKTLYLTAGTLLPHGTFSNMEQIFATTQTGIDTLSYNLLGENYLSALSQYDQTKNELAASLYRQNNVVSPTVMFTPNPGLSIYGYNNFVIYQTRLSEIDIQALDDYFQRYGYSGLTEPLSSSSFDRREYYTYVEAYDVNIKNSYGLRVRNKGIQQLNSGVRVWKVLPDSSYYDLN